jgi:hypothetical protein
MNSDMVLVSLALLRAQCSGLRRKRDFPEGKKILEAFEIRVIRAWSAVQQQNLNRRIADLFGLDLMPSPMSIICEPPVRT